MSGTSNDPGISENTTRQTNRKKPAGPLAALVVILLAMAGRFGAGGFGNGSGLLPGGQGASGRPVAESEAAAGTSIQETSADAEETSAGTVSAEETAEVTVKVIEVTVNEDGYLFQNQKCSLEDLFTGLKEGDEIHYIVQKGSKDDVDDLIDAAKEKGIKSVKKD